MTGRFTFTPLGILQRQCLRILSCTLMPISFKRTLPTIIQSRTLLYIMAPGTGSPTIRVVGLGYAIALLDGLAAAIPTMLALHNTGMVRSLRAAVQIM